MVHCGLAFVSSSLSMKSMEGYILFHLFLVLQVFGRETLSVSIKCSYRGESTGNDGKFLCMGQQLSSCDKGGVKVSSEKNRTGRFSLSDDAPAGVFTVTITDLREEDSGTYWCGEESFGSSIYTEVHLHVSKGKR